MMCPLLFLLLVALCLFYMIKKLSHWKNIGVNFVQPLPLFGNILNVILMKQNIGDLCKSIYEKTNEPLIGFFFFHEPRLLIRNLSMIKCILINDFDTFMNRSIVSNKKYDTVGSNLLFLMKSPNWNATRRKLTTVFSPRRIKSMADPLKICSQEMVEYISEKCSQNKILDVKIVFGKFLVDSINLIFYGLESKCFKDDTSPFNAFSREVFNWKYSWYTLKLYSFYVVPIVVKLFRLKFVDTAVVDFFRDIFWRIINLREKTQQVRDDAIDILIKARNSSTTADSDYLDGDVLVAQALNFFAGGVETTSATMTFALMEISRNNEIQKKLRTEILSIIEKHGSLSCENVEKMEYLDNFISETLRKYPVVPFLDRECSRKYTIPDSTLTLPKGTKIYISILGIHYNEKYYPEPHRFNPDRFNKDNIEEMDSMAFLPFGDGPRSCLGRRFALLIMKYGLAYILSNFEVRVPYKSEEKISWKPKGITLQPEGEVYIEFLKLQN